MANPEQTEKNLVPPDKLAEKIAKASPAIRHLNRRQFLLKTGGWTVGGLGLLAIGTETVLRKIRIEAEEQKKADENPQIPQDQVDRAKEEVANFRQTSEKLAKEGQIEQIPQSADSESLRSSFETLDAYEKRKVLEDKVWTLGDKAMLGIPSSNFFGGSLWIAYGYSTAKKMVEDQSKAKQKFVGLVLETRADWQETPPTEAELMAVSRGLSYLPPVGGKIPFVDQNNLIRNFGPLLDPSLTAEQQVNKVVELRQHNQLGKIYVHQLTVQGRLPDKFKYAALTLILNSPYPRDWNQPFFEAPWGKIAPLIHDGGNTNVAFSPVWQSVEGRTDFLERMSVVFEPQLEQIEKLDINDLGKLPTDTFTNARAEQVERNRLFIEAKAYQRLALALHSAVGSAPSSIPKETRAKLGQLWNNFEQTMDVLLEEYNIHGAAEVQWFREEPVEVDNRYQKRHESDWAPIQLELLALEEAKKVNPGVQSRVTQILTDITDQIDREIGLLPPII